MKRYWGNKQKTRCTYVRTSTRTSPIRPSHHFVHVVFLLWKKGACNLNSNRNVFLSFCVDVMVAVGEAGSVSVGLVCLWLSVIGNHIL